MNDENDALAEDDVNSQEYISFWQRKVSKSTGRLILAVSVIIATIILDLIFR